jgi:hypothetical protein
MILVNLSRTWPKVASDEDAARATLGDWHGISDRAIDENGDAILGIFRDMVVTAYDITGSERRPDSRVRFSGVPSKRWAHLIGAPSPASAWMQGQARPVKYLDMAKVASGTVPVDVTSAGRRAVIGGFALTVDGGLHATLVVPGGGRVTVVPVGQAERA